MIRILLFLCSVLLFLSGTWIRIRTWGSRLLYVHSFFGRFYWCYLVLWVLALAFLAGGIYIGRKKVKKEELDEKEKAEEQVTGELTVDSEKEVSQVEVLTEMETEEILCPNCQTRLKPGAIFCKKCGYRIKEKEQKENRNDE